MTPTDEMGDCRQGENPYRAPGSVDSARRPARPLGARSFPWWAVAPLGAILYWWFADWWAYGYPSGLFGPAIPEFIMSFPWQVMESVVAGLLIAAALAVIRRLLQRLAGSRRMSK